MSVSMYDIEEVTVWFYFNSTAMLSKSYFVAIFHLVFASSLFSTVSFKFSTKSSAIWHELFAVRPILAGIDLLFWDICKGSHWKCRRCGIWHQLVWISGWSEETYHFVNCPSAGANLFHGLRCCSCNTWSIWKSMMNILSNSLVLEQFGANDWFIPFFHFFLVVSIILLILFNVSNLCTIGQIIALQSIGKMLKIAFICSKWKVNSLDRLIFRPQFKKQDMVTVTTIHDGMCIEMLVVESKGW